MIILTLFTLLILKHFIIDFPAQTPYQWMNKGTYGHPGGILHAGLHGFGTVLCFVWWAPFASIILGIMDMLIHYHIDWAKMTINRNKHLTPQDQEFWFWLGLDQLAHFLTYVGILAILIL